MTIIKFSFDINKFFEKQSILVKLMENFEDKQIN